jgi:hypothetical protein
MKEVRDARMLLLLSATVVALLGATPLVSASPGGGSGTTSGVSDPGALSLFQTYSGSVGYVVGVEGAAVSSFSPGSITISGIPSGSTVLGAFLFWDVVDNFPAGSYSSVTFGGNSISGNLIGGTASGTDPCYAYSAASGLEDGTAPTYEADVTAYVTGNGLYSLTGLPAGNWATLPFPDGAGLVVVYSNPTLSSSVVELADGFGVTNTATTSETSSIPLSPAANGVSAVTTYLFGDTQNFGVPDSYIAFQGSTVQTNTYYDGAGQVDNPDDAYAFFAAYTVDVSSLVPSGTTSVSFGSALPSSGTFDCLIHMAQVVQYSPLSAGVPEFGSPSIAVAAVGMLCLMLFRRLNLPRNVQS